VLAVFLSKPRRSDPGPVQLLRSELVLRNGRLHRIGDTNHFSGIMIERYSDGMLRSRTVVLEGLLHGISEGWFTNGQLQVTEHFKHGVSHGARIKWHFNGTKRSEAGIAEGKLDGTFRKWHENGALAEQVEFSNGQPAGVSLAYFPSGTLKARVTLAGGEVIEQKFWKDGESNESSWPESRGADSGTQGSNIQSQPDSKRVATAGTAAQTRAP
jgi:antitoxin component YwqK of YwqJK toxin-antitoxin module